MIRHGFTLAELLISLAILGIIATFTIPKVLNSQADSQRVSVFKECYSVLSEVLYNSRLYNADLSTDTAVKNYFTSSINAVKLCPNDQLAEGCCTASMAYCNAGEGAVVMHNGAIIYSINLETNKISPIIDWNGEEGPNQQGEDILILMVNHHDTTVDGVPAFHVDPWPNAPATAANEQLFRDIFTN